VTTVVDDLGEYRHLIAGNGAHCPGTLSADFGTDPPAPSPSRGNPGSVDDNGVLSDSGTIRVLGRRYSEPGNVMVRSDGGEFDIED